MLLDAINIIASLTLLFCEINIGDAVSGVDGDSSDDGGKAGRIR